MRIIAVLAAAVLLLPLSSASADDTGGPQVVDGCGAVTEDPVVQPGATDICTGTFTTLTGETGPPAISFEAVVAEDFGSRPFQSTLSTFFDTADCRVGLIFSDGGINTNYGASTSTVALSHRCGAETTFTRIDVDPQALVISGPSITWTVVFEGDLAFLADQFAAGAVIDDIDMSLTGVNGTYFGGVCTGGDLFPDGCHQTLTDVARGSSPFVVAAGAGPAAVAAQSATDCATGTLADSSATSPAMIDRVHDHTDLPYQGSKADAFDIRSAWWGTTEDGTVTFSIQPAGPSHTPGDLTYLAWYNESFITIAGHSDGTFSASIASDGTPRQDVEAIPLSRDDATGQVTVQVPDHHLPAPGGELDLGNVYSHHQWYGRFSPDPALGGSSGVDSALDHGQLCTVTR